MEMWLYDLSGQGFCPPASYWPDPLTILVTLVALAGLGCFMCRDRRKEALDALDRWSYAFEDIHKDVLDAWIKTRRKQRQLNWLEQHTRFF